MLAHKAEEEAISLLHNLKGKKHEIIYHSIPSVIYTHPEVAWCGFGEDDLKSKQLDYKTGVFPFSANSRARSNGITLKFIIS